MSRAILALIFLHSIASADVQALVTLPSGAVSNCVQLDSSGNIYVAGTFNKHVFAAKLTADGSQLVYMTTVGGSNLDIAQAIAVGSDGSAYVTGYTQSTDFPTTTGAMQPTVPAQGQILRPYGFALKLNAQGTVQYATYVGGTAFTSGNGLTIDAAGNAYITGIVTGNYSGYPTTPGSVAGYQGDSGSPNPRFGSPPQTGFILKLDPTLSTALLSILGFGGSQIALDAAGTSWQQARSPDQLRRLRMLSRRARRITSALRVSLRVLAPATISTWRKSIRPAKRSFSERISPATGEPCPAP